MYFDISPKTKRGDLFGADYQLEQLKRYLSDESVRMIIIKGLRRTGKTSLLNVALNEIKAKSIKVDVREAPFYDRKEFSVFLIRKIRERIKNILDRIIKNVAGVRLGYDKFSFELFFSKEENISSFFKNLDTELGKRGQTLVLAFDEAQLLKNIHFDCFLASIFDNYKNIKIVLTGSEIGVLDKILGKADYSAPLFGRAYLEIVLGKMKEEDVAKFLEAGSRQMHIKTNFKEIGEVIENLDGLAGWITYYGWFKGKGFSHDKSLQRVKEEGNTIIKKEVENFLEGRKARGKYLKLLRYLTKGYNTWNSLKQAFRKDGLEISDTQMNLYLKELMDFGFIEKTTDKYFIADPLINSL